MRPAQRAERIEWIAGGLSAALVAAMVGFLLYEAVFISATLPDLRVTLAPPIPEAGRSHLRWTVTNDGGHTAAAVTLALILRDGAEVVERRSVTIDYVPAHSQVTGGLYLGPDAAALTAEAAVEGYVDP